MNETEEEKGQPPEKQRPSSRFRVFFTSRWAPLILFCGFSLILEENYPFSNFPMYSGIAKRTHYFYVADGEGNPIPTGKNFGKSASGIKKLYGARLDQIAKDKGTRSFKLGWNEQVQAGSVLLQYLRERGEKRGFWRRGKPEKVRLVRVDVSRGKSGIVKEERIVVEEPTEL